MIGLVNLRKLLLLKQKRRIHKFYYKGIRVRYGGSWYDEGNSVYVHFFSFGGNTVSTVENDNKLMGIQEIEHYGKLLVDIDPYFGNT